MHYCVMGDTNENDDETSQVSAVCESTVSSAPLGSTSTFQPLVTSVSGSVPDAATVDARMLSNRITESEKPSNNNTELDEETTQMRDSLSTQTNNEHSEEQQRLGSSSDVPTGDENENLRRRAWRESPFAVGLTKATWTDENIGLCGLRRLWCSGSIDTTTALTAYVCGTLGAGRVGNMVILRQSIEIMDDGSGGTIQRPRLINVVGPYWFVALCLTLPFFLGLSTWTLVTKLFDHSMAIQLTWAFCTAGLLTSLFMVSCQDPGILYRVHEIPEGADPEQWRWNSQAITYRPIHAKFDPECAVVIEHFDHTCPWTGTAIGGNNMMWFRLFLFFALATVVYNITLLMYL